MVRGKGENRRENGLLAVNVDLMKLVRSFGRKELCIVDVMLNWEHMMGEACAKELKPLALKGGKLCLSAASSGLAMEVSANKARVLEKVNAFFGREVAVDLKVVHEPSLAVPTAAPAPSAPASDRPVRLDPALYDNIEDEELKKRIFSLAQAYDTDNN